MDVLKNELGGLFSLHLENLKKEILLYENEADLWIVADGINNSAGNLTYHILGNLNNYIGFAIGNTKYIRNRPLEFSIKDVPRKELYDWIDETSKMISETLKNIALDADYPRGIYGEYQDSNFSVLCIVLTHLNYHLGQINYHRRLVAK